MRRYAKQVDGNQPEIFRALRDAKVSVRNTSMVGDGFVDAVIGYRHLTVLAEIKLPQSEFVKGGVGGRRERTPDEYDPLFGLTDAERKFHAEWQGQPIVIVRSITDALRAVGLA